MASSQHEQLGLGDMTMAVSFNVEIALRKKWSVRGVDKNNFEYFRQRYN